jgi:hypothetical protein
MSKVQLQGNASGTGVFTIASPNSNTDRTLTLPDNTGTVLTNASNLAGLTGVGKVLQVVQGTLTGFGQSTSSTSFSDTSLTASITPSSATNKILVLVNQSGCGKTAANTGLNYRLLRGATVIQSILDAGFYNDQTSINNRFNIVSSSYLDSPSTTSSVTYKTQFANYNGIGLAWVQDYGTTTTVSTIILMEIAA